MQWNGKKVLVTGGAGLIGSFLVDELVDRGAEVTILDNLDPQTHPNGEPAWLNHKARFIKGDCAQLNDWKKALPEIEYIFHQAAFGGFTSELSKYLVANAAGTALMFEAIQAVDAKVKKIVVASSQAVYGEGVYQCPQHGLQYPRSLRAAADMRKGVWELRCPHDGVAMQPMLVNENRPLDTETVYGVSKLAEEKLALGLGRRFHIPVVALRYAVTYGPRQSIFNPYTGVVSIFSTLLLNQQTPKIYEDGTQTRDFLYVTDNVAANLLVAESRVTAGEVFNVGTGVPTSVNQLVSTLAGVYGQNVSPTFNGDFRPGDVRHFVHDASKIRALGWQPRVSLTDGLGLYSQWILQQSSVKEYFTSTVGPLRESGVIAGQGL